MRWRRTFISLRPTLGMAALLLTGSSYGQAGAMALPLGATLPDAPSAVLIAAAAGFPSGDEVPLLPPCPTPAVPIAPGQAATPAPTATAAAPTPPDCVNRNPISPVINAEQRQPLTSRQKGILAMRDVVDPFNLIVISFEAGLSVAVDSHTAYGPGFKGVGRLTGYDLLQDTQGEFFGTYLIPSVAHEDPRYRRMQNASIKRRILHAFSHTLIAQHDDGTNMPNYATLLTYPISAELSNLYVPGIETDGPSTARRIAIGFATDPAGNLIAEFLPDIAKRIHVRSLFIRQIINQMATDGSFGQ